MILKEGCSVCKGEELYVLESTGFTDQYTHSIYCPRCKSIKLIEMISLEERAPDITLYIVLVDTNRTLIDKIHGRKPPIITSDENDRSIPEEGND